MSPEPDREPAAPFAVGFGVILALGITPTIPFVFMLVYGLRDDTLAAYGIATLAAYALYFTLGASRLPDPPGEALGFVPAPPRAWPATLLLAPCILLVSELDNALRGLFPPPEASPALEGLLLAEAALVWIAIEPCARELFFRGLLHRPFVDQLGRVRGVLLAAALSALPSLWSGERALIGVAAMAVVLGFLREASGSLWPPILLAMGFGLCTVLATQGVFGIPGFDDLSAAHTPLGYLVPAALSAGVGLRLCRAMMRSPSTAT